MINQHPRDLGVPHNEWRPHQYETIKWLIDTGQSTAIVQAPTGSGKSAVAGALGNWGYSRVLTHAINLQDQYAEHYDFEAIYGLRHYSCELLGGGYNCDSCLYPEAMYTCPVGESCTYIERRLAVQESRRQSLSYAYFLSAQWPSTHQTQFLYCDEAHLLPNIIRDYCTINFTPAQLYEANLPHYPTIQASSNAYRVLLAIKWLADVLLDMKMQYNDLMAVPKYNRSIKLARKLRMLSSRIARLNRTIAYAELHPNDFYCWSDKEKFTLVPLTAKLYFPDLFLSNWTHKLILTSATIGNPDTLAKELGINYHKFRDVPSSFPPEAMPVYTLKDSPRLGYATEQSSWKKWAENIKDLITAHNSAWSGIIHLSSKKQANFLANMLASMGLQDRVYVADGNGTSHKIAKWRKQQQKVPNTIALAYSFHMGLDAPDVNINIVGKIPFKTLDRFGKAELEYNPDYYRLQAAILTEQACGRIRRGRPEHYEERGKPTKKVVAIADGSINMLESELSSHFGACLTPFK